MKKALILMTGLLVLSAVNVWAAISIGGITVTGTNSTSGAVTISATISGGSATNQVYFNTVSTNRLNLRNFSPEQVVGTAWSNSNWIPYFAGDFIIQITAVDLDGLPPSSATASVTVTVTRAVSGTVNSIQYSSAPYDASGVWSNVDATKVSLQDKVSLLDISPTSGVGAVGCNLLNVTNVTPDMTAEQQDIAYTDTGLYKPAGTPYRFDLSLHARPRGFMGMGEIKRWIWAPTDTNVPDGSGRLTVDLTSCSPWRSSYSNALRSHVGFSPIFAEHSTDMPTGVIMCTSAHYMDVGTTNNTGTKDEARCGLRVNGHTDTNSYLKTFLSDTFLQQQYQLTNVYDATNVMAGFVQHFDANNVPIDDVTQVTASFTRIAGGTGTNLVYDYNFDGVGDSGYEARLNFEFHSAVAAQMGMASTTNVTLPSAPTNVAASKGTYSDKIRVTWNAVTNATSYEAWRNTVNDSSTATKGDDDYTTTTADDPSALPGVVYYYWVKARNSAGTSDFSNADSGYIIAPVTGDIDGDQKADLISVVGQNWYVWFSTAQYLVRGGPYVFNISGTPTTGDIDGDRLADIISVTSPDWYVWFSTAQYLVRGGPYTLDTDESHHHHGIYSITGDIDGDGLADLISVLGSNWYVWFSTAQYLLMGGPYDLGTSGIPTTGDIDGDGLADLIVVDGSDWYVWFSTANYLVRGGPYALGISGLPATGDIDGDGLADLISVVGSDWYVWFSTANYLVRGGPYTLILP